VTLLVLFLGAAYSTLLISHMNLSVCPNLGTDMIPISLLHGINILSRLGTPTIVC
jgi:hypothetical protein